MLHTAVAIAAIGSLAAVAEVSAAAATPTATTRAAVVKVVNRHPFGRILATRRGRTLYIKPAGNCTGGCLAVWPPLLMPRHTKIPVGARCLGTARFHRRLQVTYRGKRLYLFVGDMGGSVNGNSVGGFTVAKFLRRACPR